MEHWMDNTIGAVIADVTFGASGSEFTNKKEDIFSILKQLPVLNAAFLKQNHR